MGAPILLGSITTAKYVDVLLSVFAQATFLAEFVGRGDMSWGAHAPRVDAGAELTYTPVQGAVRGFRPPKLPS